MKTFYEYFQCRRVGQGCEPAIIPAWPKNKRKPLGNCLRARLVTKNFWRRRRDSNPRDPFESNGFQDRRFQPLTHSSAFHSNVVSWPAGLLCLFAPPAVPTLTGGPAELEVRKGPKARRQRRL